MCSKQYYMYITCRCLLGIHVRDMHAYTSLPACLAAGEIRDSTWKTHTWYIYLDNNMDMTICLDGRLLRGM